MPSWNDLLSEYEALEEDAKRSEKLVADQVSALS